MSLVTDIRDDLLGLLRATAANADAATLARVLNDINAAVQRVYELGPDFWSVTSSGAQVRAPVSLTGLTLANGETTLSGGSFATWMHGCTVQLAGEEQQNEIRQTGASTYALAVPYQGSSTAAGTGTVYHDAINLAATVTKIEPPVYIPGKWELIPAESPRDQYEPNYWTTDHGRRRGSHASFLWDTEKDTGTPEIYQLERNLTYENAITARLRLAPLPDAAYALKYRQRHAAYRVTSLSDTVANLVPHGYNETLLLPIARYLFSGWQGFALLESGADRRRIEEDYSTALQLLKKLSEKQVMHVIADSGRSA